MKHKQKFSEAPKTSTVMKPYAASQLNIPTPKTKYTNVEEQLFRMLFPHNSKLTEVVQHIFDEKGNRLSIDKFLRGDMAETWAIALEREFGRLSNGIPKELLGTKTIDFVLKSSIPLGRKVTYANMVCDFRPLKGEKYRVRLTIGGDKLE